MKKRGREMGVGAGTGKESRKTGTSGLSWRPKKDLSAVDKNSNMLACCGQEGRLFISPQQNHIFSY